MGQQQERWTGARIATMVGLWVLAMPALGLLIGNLALPRWLEPVGAAATAPGGDCAAGGAEGACSASGHGPDEAIAWLAQERAARGDRNVLFTRDRLKLFDGSVAGRPLVLCVMGECFDVSDGEQFYGAGAHYSCFAGNDGSRAYVKGEFTAEACHDDVSDFTGPEMIGVEHWLNFYKQHEHYRRVGVLVGRYHDATGAETSDRWRTFPCSPPTPHAALSACLMRTHVRTCAYGQTVLCARKRVCESQHSYTRTDLHTQRRDPPTASRPSSAQPIPTHTHTHTHTHLHNQGGATAACGAAAA